MTYEPELRYVSLSVNLYVTHAVLGRQGQTVCGRDLDERQIERFTRGVTCATCIAILGSRGDLVPA